MTRIRVELKGQDRLVRLITMKSKSLLTEIAEVGDDMMGKMVREAKQIVPVDTGALLASIEKLKMKSVPGLVTFGFSAGGEAVDYARYVEWGTSKMRPQPYMRPAAKLLHPMLLKRLAKRGKLNWLKK